MLPMRYLLYLIGAIALLYLGGCATTPPASGPVARSESPAAPTGGAARPGGYYQDDGPEANPPANLDQVPDAAPKDEALSRLANSPYKVFGQDYVPLTRLEPYSATGIASWYGKKFQGQKTSSGEPYNMYAMTAAHRTLPIPSYARVTNLKNGKSVVVKINDRGPFHSNRLIDLSYTAAYKLGLLKNGSGMVKVDSIIPGQNDDLAAATPAPSAAAPNPPAGEPGAVYVQLAAFSVEQNARSFGDRVREKLGDLASRLTLSTAAGLYRVSLGPFGNRSEAQEIARRVRDSLDISPLVVVP